MYEDIITRDSSEFKELRRNIVRAIQTVDILIDTPSVHRKGGIPHQRGGSQYLWFEQAIFAKLPRQPPDTLYFHRRKDSLPAVVSL